MIKFVVWTQVLKTKLSEERGAGLAEYALLLFVIALAAAAGVATFGGTVIDLFDQADAGIPAPAAP